MIFFPSSKQNPQASGVAAVTFMILFGILNTVSKSLAQQFISPLSSVESLQVINNILNVAGLILSLLGAWVVFRKLRKKTATLPHQPDNQNEDVAREDRLQK